MNITQAYQQALCEQNLSVDIRQQQAVARLQKIQDALHDKAQSPWQKVTQTFGLAKPIQGLYLWGGVGIGKTFLMDLFYQTTDIKHKKRMHFHRFMGFVHERLGQISGPNPIQTLAKSFAKEAQLLCFDEFFVQDIADAMLLGALMQALFDLGVTLIATSNVEPKHLYPNGLQRDKFLPAIDALYRHTQVMHLTTQEDYRLRTLNPANLYHFPLNETTTTALAKTMLALSPSNVEYEGELLVCHRVFPFIQKADSIIWLSYEHTCVDARAASDYIEIAHEFHTVILSDVKAMGTGDEDKARRFIAFVDEMYDRNVALILSANVPMNALYSGERLKFEFERTLSRLHEMSSKEYLSKPHLQ